VRIVLFGYGNESRGDDALGPRLLERAEAWLATRPQLPVRTVADFQLQIEHALDLRGADLALFVDADASCAAPCVLRRALPRQDATFSTHALSPEAVLYVCRDVAGGAPPPSYVLHVRGERFELGEPLTAKAAANLEAAWIVLQALLLDGRPEAWDAIAQSP
jgi:hydrogenase maturation protease